MPKIRTKNMLRNTKNPLLARVGGRSAGFSLIELLTVIAVIAILAAIIFPAYQKTMEKSRQGTAIDNMHRIQEAMAQYYLDNNHKYPPVLFAYSDGSSSMTNIKNAGSTYLQGLYPNYIKDASVFIDPDNSVNDPSSNKSVAVKVNVLQPDGTLKAQTENFFVGDAYDVNPYIVAPGNTSDSQLVPRYQTAWTATPPPVGETKQLDQPSAPDDTYVTMTTYHVKGGSADKILVLFKNGTIKTLDTSRVLSPGCGDVPDVTASQAKFWMIQPNGSCP